MGKKVFAFLFVMVAVFSLVSVGASAAYTPPSSFGAPEDFAVSYYGDATSSWNGLTATVAAPDDLRSFLDQVADTGSQFNAAGFYLADIELQFDYRVDGGAWHYTSDWENHLDWMANMSSIRLSSGNYSASTVFDKGLFEAFVPGETLPESSAYFDTHTMDFKVRLIVSSQDNSGTYYRAASAWSSVFSFNNNAAAHDPVKLINHAPVLKSVEIRKYDDGRPYLHVVTNPAPEDVRLLNSLSSGGVTTELWIKVGSGAWITGGQGNFVEQFDIQGAEAYFGLKESYDSAVFDVKVRYCFDLIHNPGTSPVSKMIYSPYSNVLSIRQEAYSNASEWAKSELDKADSYGLIPSSLHGADMIKPITREEFAELAVLLYEKTTGKTAEPCSPNPFTDTQNPEILKAYKLGITKGMTATTFAPNQLTNRQEVATMLSRAIRVMVPDGDFSTAGAPKFTDQADIDSWALEHVLFMAKMGIINGANGKFMPKAVTTAQIASGYATTTREQALAMSKRIFEKYQ